ncbi:unnamed protein product [Rotaria magnacalcarata]|uniref:Uncharacterized protein n=1 Tax=Rotaria magnacalcarata TaxID=392030 RepID=A0A816SAA0_9BILA|nr:unnamed protein product [Rotaria magnacalcarata]CAF2199659.1 unnamed protein product [Rotaria magnacalcarata]CAF4151364.1 unnamed protein product [Rotaria magnacalcarata]
MSRSSNRMSDYLLSSAEHEGASLFPSGLLMYDLPSLRRTASRTSNNVELMNREPPKKRSPSPVPSSSSSSSLVEDDFPIDDQPNRQNLTTSEDWWRQAIEPVAIKKIPVSQSAFSMNDDDISNDTNQLFSLLTSFNSIQRIVVHNQLLTSLTQTYSDKAIDYVKQCYTCRSVPNLNTLIKRGLVKINKEKSIRIVISNKKEIFGQLDKNGKILSTFDNRLFDSIEQFYEAYQSRRKRYENLDMIYQSVYWYDQTFHSLLLEYAETIVKISGMKTRLIADDELLSSNASIDKLPNEILCQINCWKEGRNEIDL